eukprot:TRINITY_DN2078_c0_g2_i2.p1 TRINITY_DN2078_c0_g2~~TRINITY_DN2078_c0_g2_i2.p1  ORF type:complete len:120 (-),score=18.96 TRINITY_DN2078_c0_g2_i2:191-550(-)
MQAGPVVEIHMPRDRETRRHKAYAFAEYKTQESAAYALGLFSGLVSLYNRSVRFAMSGQEKQASLGEDLKSLPVQFGNGYYTGIPCSGDVSPFSPAAGHPEVIEYLSLRPGEYREGTKP